jgi:hypothetical protein
LEDKVTNVRKDPNSNEYIANVYPSGEKVYVKPHQYIPDCKIGNTEYYKYWNKL